VEPLRRMRLMAVQLALTLSVAAGGVAFLFDKTVALGLLMGGVAGVVAFWIVAVRLERPATGPKRGVYSPAVRWSLIRLVIYAVTLWRAYLLDRETMRGLFAAAAGLFIIRLVVVFLGLTGLDLEQGE
jgi:hypothetical protein